MTSSVGGHSTVVASTPASGTDAAAGGAPPVAVSAPPAPALSVSCRMLRSPSHESVTTDLSLFSVSSLASDVRGMRLVAFKPGSDRLARGPSPNPDSKSQISITRPPDIPELLWFEEENELIKSCAALSSALGLQRSFSTSDITQLPSSCDHGSAGVDADPTLTTARAAVSEPALNSLQRVSFILDQHHLNRASRSCSTWVAVGDVASTSQLPSPHGGHNPSSTGNSLAPGAPGIGMGAAGGSGGVGGAGSSTPTPSFTPADLVRSVNKKVRQNYIRRRLLMTYKALERLSQSEFNLDRLEAAASASSVTASSNPLAPGPTPGSTPTPGPSPAGPGALAGQTLLTVPGSAPYPPVTLSPTSTVLRVVKPRVPGRTFPLTIRDVERERGKPLSKYDRNMMIFNWLHTLDDSEK